MVGFGKRRSKGREPAPGAEDLGFELIERTLSPDQPIGQPSEDLLGRAPFAKVLAAEVLRAPRDSGFVIALTGPWGSGKTSVLELIEKELGPDDVTTVVHFNPWLFSGPEQLVGHFFAELSGQLEARGSRQVKRLARALRGYGRIVSPLSYLPYIGDIARASSNAATSFGDRLSGETASAQVQAKALKESLKELDRPIVVMVDDIDRLRDAEIVDVVRLVRLVGDFPNLIYVMAFDLAVVEKALSDSKDDDNRESGRLYLEKIIHISHALPSIRPEDLTNVLQRGLADAIPTPSDYRFDEARFSDVFWANVRPLFDTVRDIRRYTNVLTSTLRLVGDEVDVSDILALEALRLFEPDVFEAIIETRYLLTGRHSRWSGSTLCGSSSRTKRPKRNRCCAFRAFRSGTGRRSRSS